MLKKEKSIFYMEKAIELAQKGEGFVSPNPKVGAIIVKDDVVIGEGFHEKYGELHAERNALKNCKKDTKGATMYVTLEPCCHYGNTPPCVDAIIESGITTVYVGIKDPNPKVSGKGIDILKNAGIKVYVGLLEEKVKEQNQIFLHYIKNKKPFVALKYAMTLDGKIATYTGKSKWITNEKSREYVHILRGKYSAILVGVNTVLVDNPMLTCRYGNLDNPIRIICDTNLRTPINSKIIESATQVRTIIATSETNVDLHKKYIDKSVEILVISKYHEHINLKELIDKLGEKNIDSILVEGGSDINFSMLNDGLVNKIYTFVAPKIFGGYKAKTSVSGIGFEQVDNKIKVVTKRVTNIAENENIDILIESEVIS